MHSQEIGDCIGVESSADLKSDVHWQPHRRRNDGRRGRRLESAAKREYPPPITWLARTDNLPSHMPWVMRKYYSGDGRLIIKEERVKHHEYFLADRSNGRLVLSLVHLDAVEDSCGDWHDPEEESDVDQFPAEEIDGGHEEIKDLTAEDVSSECHRYNGVGVKPCGGFVATAVAPVIRSAVHI